MFENPYDPIYIYMFDDDSDILPVNPCRLGWLLHVGPAATPSDRVREATCLFEVNAQRHIGLAYGGDELDIGQTWGP